MPFTQQEFLKNLEQKFSTFPDVKVEGDKEKISLFRQSRVLLIFKILSIILLSTFAYTFIRVPALFIFDLSPDFRMSLLPLYFIIFITLNIFSAFLLILVVLGWLNTYYRVGNGKIEFVSGILTKRAKTFSLEHAQEVTYFQSLLGKMFNFGNIEIYNPGLKTRIKLQGISYPQKCCSLIQKHASSEKITYQA